MAAAFAMSGQRKRYTTPTAMRRRIFNAKLKLMRKSAVLQIVHAYYGIFDAFAQWVANMSVTYPDLELWVTEFGLPGASLEETQVFFNQSLQMLDETRYALVGCRVCVF